MAPAGVALQEQVSLSRYYERFGGFATQKETGLIAYQVARAFDLLVLLVYLDQLCLDSGSTTVAWLMTLLPDPPQAIFMNPPPLPGGSLQPFSQLADQTWITSALGFVREMDLITTRRAEAKTKAPAKKPQLVTPPTEADDPAMTRKQQRAAQWAARKAAAAANPK